jgi:hypothetical protein
MVMGGTLLMTCIRPRKVASALHRHQEVGSAAMVLFSFAVPLLIRLICGHGPSHDIDGNAWATVHRRPETRSIRAVYRSALKSLFATAVFIYTESEPVMMRPARFTF